MALHRLYLDTNVFVEGFEEPACASGKMLSLAASGEFFVVESEYLVREVETVVNRLYGRKAAAAEIEQLRRFPAHGVVSFEESREAMALVTEHTRDAADTPHFAAACAGAAEALVTRNRRSVRASIFDLLPIATPEDVLPSLEGSAPWPSAELLRARWERWARESSRAPR